MTASPGNSILPIGTVDDYQLHETKLKPRIEQFTKDRVSWCHGAEGVQQEQGNYYTGGKDGGSDSKHGTVGERAGWLQQKL